MTGTPWEKECGDGRADASRLGAQVEGRRRRFALPFTAVFAIGRTENGEIAFATG